MAYPTVHRSRCAQECVLLQPRLHTRRGCSFLTRARLRATHGRRRKSCSDGGAGPLCPAGLRAGTEARTTFTQGALVYDILEAMLPESAKCRARIRATNTREHHRLPPARLAVGRDVAGRLGCLGWACSIDSQPRGPYLRSIPPEAFSEASFAMPKTYWEQLLKWTGEAGMWSSASNQMSNGN
jgi:hypothetical protein